MKLFCAGKNVCLPLLCAWGTTNHGHFKMILGCSIWGAMQEIHALNPDLWFIMLKEKFFCSTLSFPARSCLQDSIPDISSALGFHMLGLYYPSHLAQLLRAAGFHHLSEFRSPLQALHEFTEAHSVGTQNTVA